MADKAKKLYMIGNAHIDPVWLWPWTEGFYEVKATFRSALDRIREYDDFVFTAGSAAYYEWVESNDPKMFSEIQQQVKAGRWQLAGGWWIQPDCNIPCGESFVRQALYAQRYFFDKFGVVPNFGYNVDSFGHHGMLPQILLKSGLDNYIFMRPGPSEKELPSMVFWWESDDGSRVLAYRIPYSYATSGDNLIDTVRMCSQVFLPPMNVGMCFYGVGNHGGGPTKQNIESIKEFQLDPDMPSLEFSGPEAYFNYVKSQDWPIPVVHDDLQHHASGCYAAHSGVKRWNRRAENSLLAAEKWSVVANQVTGIPYPSNFKYAWKNVLFNQFHDILAGTSLESAYEDVQNFYGEAMAVAGRNTNAALQSIAWNIRIKPEAQMHPIVVFNPHAWTTQVPVEFEINRPVGQMILVDDKDNTIPYQYTQSEAAAPWRTRICFIADLPSLGYCVYRLKPGIPPNQVETLSIHDLKISHPNITLLIDQETGCISSLSLTRYGVELLAGLAGQPVIIEDTSDTWSHNVFRYDDEVGVFTPTDIRLIEQGPVKVTIRVANEYSHSRLIQEFTLYNDLDLVEVKVSVDWQEFNKLLKLRFPFRFSRARTTYEIPYGHIKRLANGEENPGQSWIDVSGALSSQGMEFGVSILNDGKYSFDSRSQDKKDVNDIGLTVLRSPAYAHHLPMSLDPNRLYKYIDQGRQTFRYYLYPHAGGWEDNHTVQRAAEINQQPFILPGAFHGEGFLPQVYSSIHVNTNDIVVSVLKQSEDEAGLILRCYDAVGKANRSIISMPLLKRSIQVDFTPCEIKTLYIPLDSSKDVKEVNLIEWDEVDTRKSVIQRIDY